MGRPDVGGNINGFGAAFQHDFQQVAAVQAQDGAAVAVQVADGFQPVGQVFRRVQPRQDDHVMHLAGLSVPLVDGADFPRHHKAGRFRAGNLAGQGVFVPEPIHAFPVLRQHFPQFLPPFGMGEIPGTHQADALVPRPQIQVRRVALAAGGPGVFGMDVQIGNLHIGPFLFAFVFLKKSPSRKTGKEEYPAPRTGYSVCMNRHVFQFTSASYFLSEAAAPPPLPTQAP